MSAALLWSVLSAHAEAPAVLAPDRRGRARPDRHLDIEAMHLDVDLQTATRSVAGTVTYTVRRLSPGPLVLDQVGLQIERVHLGVDAAAPTLWWTEGDTLRIEVPEGETRVTIGYRATPQAGLYFRGLEPRSPDAYPEVWTQGQDNDHRFWVPVYDHPDDRFAFTAEVHAPAGWKVLTNSGMTLPSYLIMIAAAPYDIHTHPADGRFSVYVAPGTPADQVAAVLDPLPAMTAHLEARTGVPYPWGVYRQAFVQRFLYGGMENTSATIQNDSLLQPAAVSDNAGDRITEVVSHELAHQWYGDLLTCRDWRELWLNEGFAEFFAGDWAAQASGEARWAQIVDEWLEYAQGGPALAGRFHQGPDAPESGRVYVKGAAVLQMLRVMLGEELFWAGIRRYTQGHQHQSVTTADLQRAMEAESGLNLDWFFQQWVELPYTPVLKVSHTYAEGTLTIKVRQDTGDQLPRYTLPYTVEVGLADGSTAQLGGWLEDEGAELTLPVAAPPRYVAFDPPGGVLARITQEQDPAAWEQQLLTSPAPYARRVAARALSKTDASDALAAVLADPARPRWERAAAAAALGEQRSEALLLAALTAPTRGVPGALYVQAAVAEALTRGNDAAATGALRRLAADRGADPYVRRHALEALVRRDPGAALAIARQSTVPRGRQEDRLAGAAMVILGAEGVARDLGLLLGPRPGRLWSQAITAAAALVQNLPDGREQEQTRARAARAIESALGEGDLWVRQAAIEALGTLGDADSVPPLEALRRREDVSSLRDAAVESLRQIRTVQAAPPQTAENDMEARLRALEERLEAAEGTLQTLQDRH